MKKLRWLLAALIVIVSSVFVLWGFWPMGGINHSLDLSPADLSPQNPDSSGIESSAGTFYSAGQLEVHWQPVIRKGDSSQVQLALRAGGQEDSTSDSLPVNQVDPGSGAYHVLAEARLEIAGLDVSPSDMISQSIIPDRPAVFTWSLGPRETGITKGVVWFTLRFLPISGGEEIRKIVSAQRIEIRSIDMLGLGSSSARSLGCGGLILAVLLGWDVLSIQVSGNRWKKEK